MPRIYESFDQKSLEWDLVRLGKLTGSQVSDALMKPSTKGYQNLKAKLIAERLTGEIKRMSAPSMDWGHAHEPMARIEHALVCNHVITEVAFVELTDDFGCSPDGLVNEDGIVEYKCPYNSSVHISTLLNDKVPPEYVPQIQWNMFVTGRRWCKFVSFDPRMPEALRLHEIHVPVDYEYQAVMVEKAEAFMAELDSGQDRLQEIIDRYEQAS